MQTFPKLEAPSRIITCVPRRAAWSMLERWPGQFHRRQNATHQEVMTMGRRAWIATAVAGLVALSLPFGWARADHVRIGATQQPSTTTVIVPPPATSTVQY